MTREDRRLQKKNKRLDVSQTLIQVFSVLHIRNRPYKHGCERVLWVNYKLALMQSARMTV
jgi:hypothetical protein